MLRQFLIVLLCALPFMGSATEQIKEPSPLPVDISEWHLPLDGPLIVTDIYGERIGGHPVTGEEAFHGGLDFRGRGHVPVYAVEDGFITIKDNFPETAGKMVEIDHENGIVTRYAHLSRFAKGLTLGAEIKKGQLLGYTGNTGRTTAEHLHFEVWVNGAPIDPFPLYGELPCKWNVHHRLCHVLVASTEEVSDD